MNSLHTYDSDVLGINLSAVPFSHVENMNIIYANLKYA